MALSFRSIPKKGMLSSRGHISQDSEKYRFFLRKFLEISTYRDPTGGYDSSQRPRNVLAYLLTTLTIAVAPA